MWIFLPTLEKEGAPFLARFLREKWGLSTERSRSVGFSQSLTPPPTLSSRRQPPAQNQNQNSPLPPLASAPPSPRTSPPAASLLHPSQPVPQEGPACATEFSPGSLHLSWLDS